MQYRLLGNSELQVSEIALGSWLTYRVTVEPERARACLMDQINDAMDKFARSGKQGRILLEFGKEIES